MKAGANLRHVRGLALFAGVMDGSTGIALVAAPRLAMSIMHLPAPTPDAMVFLRWVGVFVGGVGLSYFVALRRGGAERLRDVLETTALLRMAVGVFVAVAILKGELAPAWSTVSVIDLGIAGLQVWLLAGGAWRHE